MAVAADSWLAFIDRLLILGDDNAKEKDALKENMLKLIDIYYDALDAPKCGTKVSSVDTNLFCNCHSNFCGRVCHGYFLDSFLA
mgnify:FL=1